MKIFANNLGCCVLALGLSMAGVACAETEMERTFQSPPAAARPWAYWWWLNSNVTRQGITRDLEEMHRQGIQGVMIFNAGGGDTPQGPKFLSPEWNALFKFALSEASRLGMEASVNLCDGWCAGGPWIPAEAANKKLDLVGNASRRPAGGVASIAAAADGRQFLSRRRRAGHSRKSGRPVQPAEIRASSAVGDYCDEKNWPPADVADGDPNTIWRAAAAPTPTAPGLARLRLFRTACRLGDLPGLRERRRAARTARCKSPTTAYRSKPTISWKMAKGEAEASRVSRSQGESLSAGRAVGLHAGRPPGRNVDSAQGRPAAVAARHQVVVVQVGQSRLLVLAQSKARP